jgi:hypothetical protein
VLIAQCCCVSQADFTELRVIPRMTARLPFALCQLEVVTRSCGRSPIDNVTFRSAILPPSCVTTSSSRIAFIPRCTEILDRSWARPGLSELFCLPPSAALVGASAHRLRVQCYSIAVGGMCEDVRPMSLLGSWSAPRSPLERAFVQF